MTMHNRPARTQSHSGHTKGRPGTDHFVGAGPGAADLLTLRAVRLLQGADVCLYAGTYLDADVLSHLPLGCERVDTQHLNLTEITDVIVTAYRQGRNVVRLCSGDPSVYSALAEQTRRLDAHGVAWQVCPGVPAYAATAARVGRELTVPELAQSVVLTRAQRDSTKLPPGEKLANFAATGATLVLHLAIRHTRRLADELAEYYGPHCPVVVGSQVSSPQELILTATLATIADEVEAHGLRQAAIILVGPALGDLHQREQFVESHLYSDCRTRS